MSDLSDAIKALETDAQYLRDNCQASAIRRQQTNSRLLKSSLVSSKAD
jgi:hypothetical protein